MTTRLYLVRHGATSVSTEDRFSGAEGVELSTDGRIQAERLGERLRREDICAVYSSPLSRAIETARIITRGWPLSVTPVDALREIAHGHWEGMRRCDVEQQFGAEYAMWEQDPFTFAPSGGDSAGSSRDCQRASRRQGAGDLPQGDDSPFTQQPAGI
jgi:probable phosphoglycerate mutase